MIVYKLKAYTVPANGEVSVEALVIPAGKTYDIKGIITDEDNSNEIDIGIDNNVIAELINNMDMGNGGLKPMSGSIKGPMSIDATIKDATGSTNSGWVIIVYEEQK